MLKVGFAGFGKSFLSWNLSAITQRSAIYADLKAPYRAWHNTSVPVYEAWHNVKQAKPLVVYMDCAELEESPDIIVYGVLPDPARVELAINETKKSLKPIYFVLMGYEKQGVWPFQSDFAPIVILPWDVRHATSVLLGVPLSIRAPDFGRHFTPLVKEIYKACG